MTRINIRYLLALFSASLMIWTISCSGRSGRVNTADKPVVAVAETAEEAKLIIMKSPETDATFRCGDKIAVILEAGSPGRQPDSVLVSFDGRKVATLKSSPWEYTITSDMMKSTGRKSVKATAWLGGSQKTSVTRFVVVHSDLVPKRYTYKVVHSYPHDKEAFTQGLFFDAGVFYEGTGQEAGSSLRKVGIESGNVLRQLNLSSELFGEGITLLGDRIFEVTWRNHVGFIYEKSTFKQINKFYYQTEGWGLTTMGSRIVMSDGTNNLYFIEPESFSIDSKIEVYDNREMLDSLNELEYINGEIWANVWMKDIIARIDPATGKVLGYINLEGILNDPATDTKVNVLNGIAWDKESNRIFVTGKNWPKLFEIRVIEKP
jgi:glutaminyl-peptide cyclotransferase